MTKPHHTTLRTCTTIPIGIKSALLILMFMFSPVVKHSSIHKFLGIVAMHDFKPLDVKIVFMREELEERIYMNKPEGFIKVSCKDNLVYKLKLLYGFKQTILQTVLVSVASRPWRRGGSRSSSVGGLCPLF
jgi:hypothetical protein